MTPRWKIKFKYNDGNISEIKLYCKDKQSAYNSWNKDFEIISIEEDTDNSYLDYINTIINKSEFQSDISLNDNCIKHIYKFPHNDSFILVNLYTKENEYYDYCEFQRWDCQGLLNPISWTMSNPKFFCEMFDCSVKKLPQGFTVTPKEIKKMKAKKFYNKENEVLWVDDLGYIYSADKSNLPNKCNKNEYSQFHDNLNAIYVEYVLATPLNIHGDKQYKWFDNEESFLEFYEKEKTNVPSYATSPRYTIKKRGYTKIKPDDRKVILRLPYMNVKNELAYGVAPEDIAISWSNMCNKSWQSHNFDCTNYLVRVITYYKEWLYQNKE